MQENFQIDLLLEKDLLADGNDFWILYILLKYKEQFIDKNYFNLIK